MSYESDEKRVGVDVALPASGEGLVGVTDKQTNVDTSIQQVLQKAPTDISAEDSKRVLRKLDLVLMPMLCLVVLFQFLDKSAINYANLLGVQEALGLKGDEYSWLGSIFYFGYLAASPIHGYFLQHVDLSRYATINILLWGTTLLCHAAVFNFASFATARFFLGVFEGAITPAFILLTGRFYTRREQIPRTCIWFSMNGWAQMLGGLISYALLARENNGNVELWQQLFLILGALTTAFGLLFFFCMPSNPATTKLLTVKERGIAVERIRVNKTGINDRHFKISQAVEAFKDPRLYLVFLIVVCGNVVNGSITFASAVIKGFGFSQQKTALLGMTTGAAEIVAVMLGIALAVLTKTRVVPGVLSQMIALLGAALSVGLPKSNQVGRMAAYDVLFFYPVVSPFVYSWLSSMVGGSSKKIVFNVVLQLGYCMGNIIGPQSYVPAEAPNYISAKITMLVMLVLVCIFMSAISAIHYYENRKRDRAGEFGQDEHPDIAFSDLTDKQIRSFRYPM